MTSPTLQLRHLTKCFGKLKVIDDLSLEIAGPQVVCLLGPNGAGKSTLMRMITGFLPPDSGTIRIDGHPLDDERLTACGALG